MLRDYFKRWRARRMRWQADARHLIGINKRMAFHLAQIQFARARVAGEWREAWHWTKVAAEIARICPEADLDAERSRQAIRASGIDYY